MDEYELSKVYIQTDAQGRITRCEGGYTMSNIVDLSEWIFIDEGEGDRYNLCQSHYFENGLYTDDGIHRWVYEDEDVRPRTDAEMEADREASHIHRAARDFDPGEYMTVEGIMYRVELPILAGSIITPGTNVTATTIEAEMARLNEGES